MEGNKDLAVLCFVYSGQIIQTTDIPAVFPAVVPLLQAGAGERGITKVQARGEGVCLMCVFTFTETIQITTPLHNMKGMEADFDVQYLVKDFAEMIRTIKLFREEIAHLMFCKYKSAFFMS